MTLQERLDKLVQAGAAIAVNFPDDPTIELTLAKAQLLKGPKRVRWCAIHPVDQHHVHDTEYDTAKVHHGRDVAFMEGDRIKAYVCPVEESGLVFDDVREALAEWRALLAVEGNPREFQHFFDEALEA